MSRSRPLNGSCSCGRNKYFICVPDDSNDVAQVFFDRGSEHRRSQASPLSAWLRVPLLWHQSTTYSFYEDETPSSIRRTYTSPTEPDTKRNFCGFCGTPLSFWTESSPEEANYICITLGSLATEDLQELEELGLLPTEAAEDAQQEKEQMEVSQPSHVEIGDDMPWFDTMIRGSQLGKISRRSVKTRAKDGSVTVEWEIVEWDDGADAASGKRKLGDLEDEESMEGVRKEA